MSLGQGFQNVAQGGARIQMGGRPPQQAPAPAPAFDAPPTDGYRNTATLRAAQQGAKAAAKKVDDALGDHGFGVADPLIRPTLKLYALAAGAFSGAMKSLFSSK